jgi:hypothetical protein
MAFVGLIGVAIEQGAILKWMNDHPVSQASIYGPLLADEALLQTVLSLLQSVVVVALFFWLFRRMERQRWVIPAFCLLVAADLAWANSRHVRMVPQSLFEGKSKVVKLIEEAEKLDPTPGGFYRVHRMPIWNPPGWNLKGSDDRVRDFVKWERSTIQPKYYIHQNLSK